MKNSSKTVLVVSLVGATLLSSASAQSGTECVGMSDGYLTVAPVTGYPYPQAPKVWLSVDVPEGATATKVEMFAKAHTSGGTWRKCTPGTDCENAIFPPIAIRDKAEPNKDLLASPEVSKDGKYVPDATTHYSGLVSLVQACGGNPPVCFSTQVWIRLAVTYKMSGATSCVAQQSWEISANSNSPMTLTVPADKTILGFDTFASELPPAATVWQSCDVWNNGTYSVHDHCVAGPPGAIGYIETAMKNEVDNAPGFYNICSNASGSLRRACRVRIRYK